MGRSRGCTDTERRKTAKLFSSSQGAQGTVSTKLLESAMDENSESGSLSPQAQSRETKAELTIGQCQRPQHSQGTSCNPVTQQEGKPGPETGRGCATPPGTSVSFSTKGAGQVCDGCGKQSNLDKTERGREPERTGE